MTNALVCWKCGATLADQPLPLSRLAVCSKCHSYLHACRLCVSYDPRLTRRCREQDAEEVTDKERANFCGYFKARPGAYRPAGTPGCRPRVPSWAICLVPATTPIRSQSLDPIQAIFAEISGTYVAVTGIIPMGVG